MAGKRWEGGSSRSWRKVRQHVFATKGTVCLLALPGCTYHATEVHHTSPRELVGDDPRYLIPTCHPCNMCVGPPERHDPPPAPNPGAWW